MILKDRCNGLDDISCQWYITEYRYCPPQQYTRRLITKILDWKRMEKYQDQNSLS